MPPRIAAPWLVRQAAICPAKSQHIPTETIPLITLKNVTLRRGAKVLLDAACVTINPGEKVGLVGRNGAGKSSLFALFNGSLHEDGGEYYIPAQWRMGQVAQDMPETEQSATDFVVDGDTTLLAAQREVSAAEATDDYDRMAHAYMALQDAGAHDAPALGVARPIDPADDPLPERRQLQAALGFGALGMPQGAEEFDRALAVSERILDRRLVKCPVRPRRRRRR